MKIYGLARNDSLYNKSFQSRFIPNKTLELAFEDAEKKSCKYFLSAIKTLINDGQNRTIEVIGNSKQIADNYAHTETKIVTDRYEQKLIGFPNSYMISPNRMIAVDAQILIKDLAKTIEDTISTKYLYMSEGRIKEELMNLKKNIFK